MINKVGNLYTFEGAAEYLGVTLATVRNLVRVGDIQDEEIVKDGSQYLFEKKTLDRILATYYNEEGLTHRDIGDRYGISRQRVHAAFQDLGVQSAGYNRRIKGAPVVYSEKTVRKFAQLLRWKESTVEYSQTPES